MIHPYSKFGYWYGDEVEGQGAKTHVKTVFFGFPPDNLPSVLEPAEAAFVCEWCRPSVEWIAMLARLKPTTIGCYPHEVATFKAHVPGARLMVRADFSAPWVHLLGPEDEVSIGVPFHLRTWRAGDAVVTTPDQYKDDHL